MNSTPRDAGPFMVPLLERLVMGKGFTKQETESISFEMSNDDQS